MSPPPSTVSFIVRRPTPVSRPSSSGPESDGPFKVPALPRHLTSAGSSTAGSPLAGSPRTFSSRGDSDDDAETGIVFSNGTGADDSNYLTDSSDEENLVGDSKRHFSFHQKKKKASDHEAPLVIPAQPNPDWREAARRRRAACSRIQPHTSRATPSFVPDSALAATGADGSVGGLGTRDAINSGPQLSGLQIHKSVEAEEDDTAMVDVVSTVSVDQSVAEVVRETEEQRALRAILAGEDESTPFVEIIPIPPLSEADALKQDVHELPDVATADDYERVPISAFGTAMLRGMGWTDGAVAPNLGKRRKNALTELYLPQARPALLGIGAKERRPDDDGTQKNKSKSRDMRYIPITRKESRRDDNRLSRSGTASGYSSHSPSRKEREGRAADRERSSHNDHERRTERDRDRNDESRKRTKDYDERAREWQDHKDRDRDRDAARARERSRSGSIRDRESGGKRKQHDELDRTREDERQNHRNDRWH